MKRALFVLMLLCALLFAAPASAAEVIAGGNCYNSTELTWALTDDGTLTISGQGAMGDMTAENQIPWYAYREQIKKIVVSPGVTAVGANAFFNCPSVEEVELPESVTVIRPDAFAYCSALRAIAIPEGVREIEKAAFRYCTALADVKLPEGLVSIGEEAFKECDALAEIDLPETLTTIGPFAFESCGVLKAVAVPKGVTVLEKGVFKDCTALADVTLPEGLTTIGQGAFWECDALVEIELPEGLETIDYGGFYNCSELSAISIPDSVTSIGEWAFGWCWRMTTAKLPAGLTEIKGSTFYSCYDLTEAAIPAGVTSIGEAAFYRTALEELILPEKLTAIGNYAFFSNQAFPELVIPGAVTSIGAYAFNSCISMKTLTLEEGIEEIGAYAFQSCRKLYALNFPESLSKIGDFAFERCDELQRLWIPAGVELLGTFAFSDCYALHNVVFEGRTTGITSHAFADNSSYLTLWGYAGIGVERYAAAEEINFRPLGEGDILFSNVCEDGLNWSVSKDGILTLSGNVNMRDYIYTIRPPWEFLADRITGLVVADDVPYLSDRLFKSYPNEVYKGYPLLKTLYLGSSLTDIGTETFAECPTLEEITLSPDNSTYLLKDDVLYSADGKTLVLYPCGREDVSFTVPAEVETIGDDAFRNSKNLKDVVLPEGLLRIERRSFYGCSGMEGMTIPSAMTFTNEDAFYACRVKTDRTELTAARNSNNVNDHNYINGGTWTDVINAYVNENEDGSFSRVEYTGGAVIVEQYVREGSKIRWESGFSLRTDYELPIFGGYYTDGAYHYLVFGNTNYAEDNGKEVLRIVQYSKDWSLRLSSACLCGANTTVPFDAGTLRMAHWDNMLYVHTSHKMYTYTDGLRHQASLSAVVNTETMRLTDKVYGIEYSGRGYISHSFNQFVAAKDGVLATVDHGDAYPRSVALVEYGSGAASGELKDGGMVDVFPIAGTIGDNWTGVAVGAFEITDEAYLVAGASENQVVDDDYWWSRSKNVFLTVTPRDRFSNSATEIHWITNYADDDYYEAAPPYLTKVAADKYLLMWTKDDYRVNAVYYTYVDGAGNVLGEIKSLAGCHSDCTPIAVDGGAMWYVTQGGAPVFYYLKGDTLLTSNSADGSATIASYADCQLVTAVYDDSGRLQDVRIDKLSDGKSVALTSSEEGTVCRYLVENGSWKPLCLPFA